MNQLRLCNRSRAVATHLASFSRAWAHSSETGATPVAPCLVAERGVLSVARRPHPTSPGPRRLLPGRCRDRPGDQGRGRTQVPDPERPGRDREVLRRHLQGARNHQVEEYRRVRQADRPRRPGDRRNLRHQHPQACFPEPSLPPPPPPHPPPPLHPPPPPPP